MPSSISESTFAAMARAPLGLMPCGLAAFPDVEAGVGQVVGVEGAQPVRCVRRGVPRQVGQHPHHFQVALDLRHVGGVAAGRGDTLEQLADRSQVDTVLAEPGQHATDVVGEHRRWADHQHPAVGEPAPVGVEQVGRAVQGDLRLAGAGATGDEGDAVGGRADRLVLLALDGGDDVAHVLAAFPGQGLEQGALADHAIDVRRGQHVVVEVDDLGTAQMMTRRRSTPSGSPVVAR